MLTALAMAGFILAAGTVGGSGTIKILIYKDPGFQQDWASSGLPGPHGFSGEAGVRSLL